MSDLQSLIQGLDSLYVSYYLDTDAPYFDWDELTYRRDKIRSERNTNFEKIDLGYETFALKPYGAFPYTYVFGNKDFEVRLGENIQPCCYVQFFSEALWTYGVDALSSRFVEWCQSVNLPATAPEVVSRADWAFDYQLPRIDFDVESFVSRAEKDSVHRDHGSVQTFTFGRGAIVVRIYDKVAEITQQSQKAFFFELWGRSTDVWRIEFQVRLERLKPANINTLSELADFQFDLLRELSANHTSLRVATEDSNRSRWPFHPLWQQLVSDIDTLPQWGVVNAIDTTRPLEWRIYQLCKSLYGNLRRLSANQSVLANDGTPLELEKTMELLETLLEQFHNPLTWKADVQKLIEAEELGQ